MKTFLRIVLPLFMLSAAQAQRETDLKWQSLGIKVNFLSMGRVHSGTSDFPSKTDYTEWSNSIATTLNYNARLGKGFQIDAQYVFAKPFLEMGNCDCDAQQTLGNDEINMLNKISLRYSHQFQANHIEVKLGRIDLKSPYFPTYNIRQKDQSYEALQISLKTRKNAEITLGHVHRFSMWRPNAPFKRASQFLNLDYEVPGMQFLNFKKQFSLAKDTIDAEIYEVYAHKTMNTVGVNLDWQLYHKDHTDITIATRWVNQAFPSSDTAGSLQIFVNLIQLGAKVGLGPMVIGAGSFFVTPQVPDGRIVTPFEANNLMVKEPLYEIDLGATTGSKSFFVDASIALKSVKKQRIAHRLYSLYFRTYHLIPDGYTDEIDLIYSCTISPHLSTALKLAYAQTTLSPDSRNGIFDGRLFFTYQW
ncbi:hypothetical protein [Fluviicola taffensis]|uniref:hypothetical protein n=1 Tax=Fluviicola taffensis TaxID=191579 RepID=UPI0031378378